MERNYFSFTFLVGKKKGNITPLLVTTFEGVTPWWTEPSLREKQAPTTLGVLVVIEQFRQVRLKTERWDTSSIRQKV